MADLLERVVVRFPVLDTAFSGRLAALLHGLGREEDGLLGLAGSDPAFYPRLFLDFAPGGAGVRADFLLVGGEGISVGVENTTGLTRASPHSYAHLGITVADRRLVDAGIRLVGSDHVGINLPWFGDGLHPQILCLRDRLAARCLYHRFPSGEPWDFIIPGDRDEIARRKPVDYTRTRRPKFELVSFGTASTPLVQLDVQVNASYEELTRLFPEALDDPEFRNIWVYLESPYGIDVCLVLNEPDEHDWSGFFSGARL